MIAAVIPCYRVRKQILDVLSAIGPECEAIFVVEDIIQRVRQKKTPLGEFAILFRTAVQPRLFEMQLRHYGVPYNLVGGMSFFERKEVRDILAYLKLIVNPDDEPSLLRVLNTPPRPEADASSLPSRPRKSSENLPKPR